MMVQVGTEVIQEDGACQDLEAAAAVDAQILEVAVPVVVTLEVEAAAVVGEGEVVHNRTQR